MGAAKVYVVTSGKGGVGKTTIVANLGLALARFGKKVLMIDADVAMPNLATLFGVKEIPGQVPTLYDLLRKRKADIKQAIHEIWEKAHIIPCSTSLEGFLRSNLDLLKNIVTKIKKEYDYVIIDTSSGLSQQSLVPLEAADEVLLVTTPDVIAVENAFKMKTAVELLGFKVERVIINRIRKRSLGDRLHHTSYLTRTNIETTLGAKTIGIIPYDEKVLVSADTGKPIVAYKPNHHVSKAFKLLAANLIKETIPT